MRKPSIPPTLRAYRQRVRRTVHGLELTIESLGPDNEISQALSSSLPTYALFLKMDRRQLRRRRKKGQTYL